MSPSRLGVAWVAAVRAWCSRRMAGDRIVRAIDSIVNVGRLFSLQCSNVAVKDPAHPHYIRVAFRQLLAMVFEFRQHFCDGRCFGGPSSTGNPEAEWSPLAGLNLSGAVRGMEVATEDA